MDRFVPFGADHLAALCLVAIAAIGLAAVARSGARERLVRQGLAASLLLVTALTIAHGWRAGTLSPWDVLPLHLCDFLILVAAFTLVTRNHAAAELLYFWAGAGTVLALLGPDLLAGFPSWGFVSFFLLHGLVVIAAAVVTFGLGLRPREGAPWRVFALTNAYALGVGLVNGAFGTNYLFLRAKPEGRTLLDWFGPWPFYLFVTEAVALVLFLLMDAPFRRARTASAGSLARPSGGR